MVIDQDDDCVQQHFVCFSLFSQGQNAVYSFKKSASVEREGNALDSNEDFLSLRCLHVNSTGKRLIQCLLFIMNQSHKHRRSNVFGDARFWFCRNLITFAQISAQFCPNFAIILPKSNQFCQISFARVGGCIPNYYGIDQSRRRSKVFGDTRFWFFLNPIKFAQI